MEKDNNKKFGARNIAFIGMSVALMAICSWISIPATIPFTLQTFAIFITLYILGFRDGSIAIITYITLGVIGVPVFSNFGGGLGVLMGPTGGYILGFIPICLVYFLFEVITKKAIWGRIVSSIIGLAVCYFVGTVWFLVVYNNINDMTITNALMLCVVPFIIPDLIKIFLGLFISIKLNKVLDNDRNPK